MRLFHTPGSPYARKVRAAIHVLQMTDQIELIKVDLADPPAELMAANPLGKVPALVTPDGVAIYDSPVIIDYLSELTDSHVVVPSYGATRWLSMKQQALGDGIADAAIFIRRLARANVPADNAMAQAQFRAIRRSIDLLEVRVPGPHPDVGKLAIAAALDFLNRVGMETDWAASHPALARWFDTFMQLPCMTESA
ncbi:glutathione S-transferase [Ameyamaea chiangmaiensis NBRC 103196]|uniref:Glutathione S-transferase n=1 Tax=Ameyamaea chiangmaiensis TaxID=442969 RepID=A0A850PHP7_9PROT|nr:glutathione S-transferase [Ameyamaea chiangmaiensis]MBS4074453.1 glutathione S-transferase [Ameyamaea chiangmaiensis]NVN41766.1 glutathione S-transferase [Ameyamaea chiangmaiensis]GBQ72093.1 glutathione S-transferase [Ameyamaea chiangmaiensis NBRC 103196]